MRHGITQNPVPVATVSLLFCFAAITGCVERVDKEDLIGFDERARPKTGPDGEPLKTFLDGGSLTLTVAGKEVNVPIDYVEYLNADEGDFDVVEFNGDGTYILFRSPGSYDEDDAAGPYANLVGKAFTTNSEYAADRLMVRLPGLGDYEVQAGEFALTRFEMGLEEVDFWEGTMMLHLKTSQGVNTVMGKVATGISAWW